MSAPLKILHVCSEVASFVKSGGLADVCDALPRAQQALGHDVRIVLPMFGAIPTKLRGESIGPCEAVLNGQAVVGELRETTLPDSTVPVYLVEHAGYFERDELYGDYADNLERFSFFGLAALDGIGRTGWSPDIVHCHDWHAGGIPAYLKTRLKNDPRWSGKPSIFTIHNIAYQGAYSMERFASSGFDPADDQTTPLTWKGNVNLMRAAIGAATKINTVSRTYAEEIMTPRFGHGLEAALCDRKADVSGIVNGADYRVWDPATDTLITSKYTPKTLDGKAECKRTLQTRTGLTVCDAPLIGMVTRLVHDKGMDLVTDSIEWMMDQVLQIAVLGKGDLHWEHALMDAAVRYPGRIHITVGYDESMAHQIYAGADFYLMPSHTEPCGLSQIYAMKYGTVPIVHRTGGLADTVDDATKVTIAAGSGAGIVYNQDTRPGFQNGVMRALNLYQDQPSFDQVRRQAMQADFSWDVSAKAYIDLYHSALGA